MSRRRLARARSNRPVATKGNAPWTELEQAFFAAAPPDEALPVPLPDRFDDLGGPSDAGPMAELVRRIAAALRRFAGA